jgi:hypothetical protein
VASEKTVLGLIYVNHIEWQRRGLAVAVAIVTKLSPGPEATAPSLRLLFAQRLQICHKKELSIALLSKSKFIAVDAVHFLVPLLTPHGCDKKIRPKVERV